MAGAVLSRTTTDEWVTSTIPSLPGGEHVHRVPSVCAAQRESGRRRLGRELRRRRPLGIEAERDRRHTLPDPPSTALIVIGVADETNAGGKLGVPSVSVRFRHERRAGVVLVRPVRRDEEARAERGIGRGYRDGRRRMLERRRTDERAVHLADVPGFAGLQIRRDVAERLDERLEETSSASVTMPLLIQPVATSGSVAASMIS